MPVIIQHSAVFALKHLKYLQSEYKLGLTFFQRSGVLSLNCASCQLKILCPPARTAVFTYKVIKVNSLIL